MPLAKKGTFSLEADMKFGWKPTESAQGTPIPLSFD